MRHTVLNRTPRMLASLLGLVLMASAPFASADNAPWLVGPSVSPVGIQATFGGGNFAPGSSVQIRTSALGTGNTTTAAVSANPDGTISYAFVPTTAGTYNVAVVDSTGKEIASTKVISR
ncbi:MAG: hypothetical protein H6R14_2803 [Proteobacteria bacterium]|nr:hypothetical protein [Pseudomonadota bacterium]